MPPHAISGSPGQCQEVFFQDAIFPMLLVDPSNGAIVAANNAACSFYGYPKEKFESLNITSINVWSTKKIHTAMGKAVNKMDNRFFFKHRLANGEIRDVEVFSGPVNCMGRDVLYSIILDQTGHWRTQRERDNFFELSVDMLCIANFKGRFLQVNDAWTRYLGWTGDELVSRPWIEFVHPADRKRTLVKAKRLTYEHMEMVNFETRFLTRSGEARWLCWNTRSDFDENRVYGIARDVTEKKQLEANLYALATTDSLTKALTRRQFMELACKELTRASRYKTPVSFIMADIDDFKKINDSHGHLIGDKVLVYFADVLRETLRDADLLGRLGGEEFAILLPETGQRGAESLAERLVGVLNANAFSCGKCEFTVTASFGVAMCESTCGDPEAQLSDLLSRADKSLYQAKESGKNCYRCCCELREVV